MLVNAPRKQVAHLLGGAKVHAHRERLEMLPEGIANILEDIDSLRAKELILRVRGRRVPVRAFEVGLDERRRELRFSHRNAEPEREDRVDEAARVADAHEPFAAELPNFK